MTDLSILQL
jgi:hypothetical protein